MDDFEFYAKAIAYETLGNYDMALVNFDKAIKYDPQNTIAYMGRGRMYLKIGKDVRALADFDKAVYLKSKESTDVEQSESDSEKRENDPATSDIHELIQQDPRPWFDYFRPGDAYHERGKAYLRKGDNDRAIADFDRAIQLDPESANTYNDRGAAYAMKGDYDRAIADLDKAIQLNPRVKNAHYNRGLAYKKKGDEARARADFEKEEQLKSGGVSVKDLQEASPPQEKAEGELPPKNLSSPLGVLKGRALKLAQLEYPASAKNAGVSGSVEVKVLIDEQGKVISAEAISGDPLLRDASVEAAKNSLFSPTQLDGKPVKVSGVILYNFAKQ